MHSQSPHHHLGATPLGTFEAPEGVRFRLWAPSAKRVELVCDDQPYDMDAAGDGYFELVLGRASRGSLYGYRLDGGPLWPDPASRFQPEGVHGLSEVIDCRSYTWHDRDWAGVPRNELSIYELHVGTFTPEGSFEAARARIPYLRDLGITAIELLPLADFPGRWNWGYDPAALWAPARAYGRPDDLRAFVDEAHAHGIAVLLDVVYNHLGPDGAFVAAIAPFFTPKHETPWGQAINLDGDQAAGVRAFLLASARHWLEEYHLDGMRLDATFALIDDSPTHVLAELSEITHTLPGPRRVLIAEDHPSNLDPLLRPRDQGGRGLDGVWADDFHHIVRRIVAGDSHGYFRGYPDTTEALASNIERGWYPPGPHVHDEDLQRSERDPEWAELDKFVLCIQNHDQIGNRATGDRLHHAIELDTYRALSALLLFLPEIPLLFQGQEWAASSPFQYFTDHNDELGKLVSEGRRREFSSFPDFEGEIPDPQEPETFKRSKLIWQEREQAPHRGVLALYRMLLAQRRTLRGTVRANSPVTGTLIVQRGRDFLVVALKPGLSVPLPAELHGREPTWHSEAAPYAETPRPPRVGEDAVDFEGPAAVLFRDPI